MDCSAISEAMTSHGGFPSTIFVREEMKTTWSILVDGITNKKSKWVIIGSPGVGKSILTVLLCFYLARNFNMSVFLARKLKGENSSLRGRAAICIEPAGRVVAYPSRSNTKVDLDDIFDGFWGQMETSQRLLLVLDGWAQAEMVGGMQDSFGGFDLLATSAQYNSKGQDVHRCVLLPAWKGSDLESLWGQQRPGDATFKEQLYYSGGSARELLGPIDDIRSRIDEAIAGLDSATCVGLLSKRGGRSATGIDTLRRCYTTITGPEGQMQGYERNYVVDSAYALNRLCAIAPLGVYESSLTIAMGCGSAHHGLMFEALVHQLFRVPNICITFHVRLYTRQGVTAGAYESIAFDKDMRTECSGANEADAIYRLSKHRIGMDRASYWHPEFPIPMFPIDRRCLICARQQDGVLYPGDCGEGTRLQPQKAVGDPRSCEERFEEFYRRRGLDIQIRGDRAVSRPGREARAEKCRRFYEVVFIEGGDDFKGIRLVYHHVI